MHTYVVENWRRQPILLILERVVDKCIYNNLTTPIIRSLSDLGGLLVVDLANKVVRFGVDGVTIFEGLRTSVTIQLMNKHNPFLVGIHCMAHWSNLAMQTLSSLSLVVKIEALFFSMYTYYS
jgi:hypothetical protein